MDKILSVIIPTYNMEALLDQCLTSLILHDKKYREMLDVIVVIDGATDRSSEIAHSYADKYPEMFSVIDKENGNYGSCINAALPHVKGKYVRILDADDSYYKDNLYDYLNILKKQNVDLILSNFDTVNEHGQIISNYIVKTSTENPMTLHDIRYEDFIPMHSVAYKSSIFNEIDYHQTEGVSYTDLEWVFHPMSCVKTVFHYNKPIYRYLVGREGQTVEACIRIKRLGHMEKGLWTQLSIFSHISSKNFAYDYLLGVIRYRVKLLYTWGLDRMANYDLRAFDKKLKQANHEIYNTAGHFTQPVGILNLQMPIVRMWRIFKRRNALLLFPLYDLRVIVNKLKHC